MWDEKQIQYSSVYEIAEALMNNEVDIVQLKFLPAFAAKARLVEEAVWNFCKNINTINGYLKYINIYPHGIHACEIDDRVWYLVWNSDRDDAYQTYLTNFPNGIHAEEAKKRVIVWYYPIQGMPSKEWFEKKRIIDALIDDPNAYSLDYLKAMEFTPDELVGILHDNWGQVRNEVLKSWEKVSCHLQVEKTPSAIPSGTTEVYFWGIPGAGHTCLIASILNTAKKMGFFSPHPGEGLVYMMELASSFEDCPTVLALLLPDRTAVEGIQCLPLNLIEYKGKKQIEHRLSIIENSGEIFECFAAMAENKPLKTALHEETFKHLLSNERLKPRNLLRLL